MPLFTYIDNIPDGPNNPSTDQPNMKINTNSINSIIDQDHISFNQNNGGLHRQVRLPVHGSPPGTPPGSIPPGLVLNEGTLYTKTGTGETPEETQLFYTPDNLGDEYQLTRTSHTDFAEFATNTVYDAGPPQLEGGWTFLPGGMLFQYGFISLTTAADQTIRFPKKFTNPAFSVTITALRATGLNNVDTIYIKSGTVSDQDFQIHITSINITSAYWMAIGV